MLRRKKKEKRQKNVANCCCDGEIERRRLCTQFFCSIHTFSRKKYDKEIPQKNLNEREIK